MDFALLQRALTTRRPSKESAPELLPALLQARLLIGVAVGVVCGLLGLTGWSGFVLYAATGVGGLYLYVASGLDADVESFGAPALLMEGTQAGLGAMLLAWTILFQLHK